MKNIPLPHNSRWQTTGHFTPGIGKASVVAATDQRQEIMRRLFGTPLQGTFNIRCRDALQKSPVAHQGDGLAWRHVVLEHETGKRSGWAMVQRSNPNVLECFTKSRLPEAFRDGEIRVSVLRHWSASEAKAWAEKQYAVNRHRWWQSWPWLPAKLRRGTSARVWDELRRESWEGAKVLDYGCNEGYFATRCAQAGAIVTAADKNTLSLTVARTIGAHIEGTDVTYVRAHEPPEGVWDVVLCLSVLHQIDPAYEHLEEHLGRLRARARRAVYLELMTPPLSGRLSSREIDAQVGGEKLLTYKHPVRRVRTLYRIPGLADEGCN